MEKEWKQFNCPVQMKELQDYMVRYIYSQIPKMLGIFGIASTNKTESDHAVYVRQRPKDYVMPTELYCLATEIAVMRCNMLVLAHYGDDFHPFALLEGWLGSRFGVEVNLGKFSYHGYWKGRAQQKDYRMGVEYQNKRKVARGKAKVKKLEQQLLSKKMYHGGGGTSHSS